MKPHPFSEDAEGMMRILYRRTMDSETKALRFILGDLFAKGFTEDQIREGFNDFMCSNPATHSLRVFRAFFEKRYTPDDVIIRERAW